jgi:hypothetical protein
VNAAVAQLLKALMALFPFYLGVRKEEIWVFFHALGFRE